MSNVDQLLSKAMSTSSEEEAIACLRMARKRGSTVSAQPKSTEDVSYWKNKAEYYYKLSIDWQKLARRACEETESSQRNFQEMVKQNRKYKNECDQLNHKLLNYKITFVGVVVLCVGTVTFLV